MHPHLPFQQRILIGLKSGKMEFYTYQLDPLHSASLDKITPNLKTYQHVTGGPSFVTTRNEYTVFVQELINGKAFDAEFDLSPYPAQLFVQTVNEARVHTS